MNADQLTRIRGRCETTAFPGVPLELFQTAHADRVALLAEVDRLTGELQTAERYCLELPDKLGVRRNETQ